MQVKKPKLRLRPAPKDVRSRVVYDRKTGEIVHTCHFRALMNAKLPSDEEIDRLALSEAGTFTGRSKASLATLSFSGKDRLERAHRVDVKARKLVRDAEGDGKHLGNH